MSEFIEIQQLLHRYCFAHDEQDVESFRDVFAKDATFLGQTGPDAIVAAYSAGWGVLKYKRRHILSNHILLDLTDNSATMQTYITLYLVKEGVLEVHLCGVYVDYIVREDGEWKLHHRDNDMDVEYNPGDFDVAALMAQTGLDATGKAAK